MRTTLLKITNAYCTFVNGGKKISPHLITRIQDRRGKLFLILIKESVLVVKY